MVRVQVQSEIHFSSPPVAAALHKAEAWFGLALCVNLDYLTLPDHIQ